MLCIEETTLLWGQHIWFLALHQAQGVPYLGFYFSKWIFGWESIQKTPKTGLFILPGVIQEWGCNQVDTVMGFWVPEENPWKTQRPF